MIYAVCIDQAAAAYGVKQSAIVEIVSHHPAGGVGVMGIPDAWLPILRRAGFSVEKVISSPCSNIAAGAWIIALYQPQSPASAQKPGQEQAGGNVTADKPVQVGKAGNGGDLTGCITSAAEYYHLPLRLFSAVLATEGGQVGQIHWNKNGSYDMGPAQINSSWLPRLAEQGISRSMVTNNGCLNVAIGAWILGQAMEGADPGNPAQFWQHVGSYNSTTPYWNQRYARMVWSRVR